MTTLTLRKEVVSRAVVMQSVVAISVAALYFLLAKMNPASAFIGVPALSFIASLRLSNLLRPLVIAFPGASFGIAMGSQLVNASSGKVALFGYAIMPIIMLGISLFFYGVSNAFGRSTIKDLLVIAAYGATAGIVVSLNIISLSVILDGTVWSKLLQTAVMYRVLLHTLISLAGYPILKLVEGIYEKDTSSK